MDFRRGQAAETSERRLMVDGLSAFGLFAVTAMLVCYALEDRSAWFILGSRRRAGLARFTGSFKGRGRSDWLKRYGRSWPFVAGSMSGRRARTEADRVALLFLGIRQSSSRLHYAWIIVAVCFAVAVMTAGVRSTPGVLIVPLEDEFGWSRATISFPLGINLLLFGAIGPFAAAVMDRFGARRTITLALAVTAASVVLTPAMSQPWQLVLLWGVVVGLSTGFVASACPPGLLADFWPRISPDVGSGRGKDSWLAC
jgi:hypothetical protein